MLICMRTTLDINDDLYREAKLKAAAEGTTLTRIVEEAIRQYLQPPKPKQPYKFQWKTERGRLLPGINVDDRASVYELMESDDESYRYKRLGLRPPGGDA